MFGVEFLPQNLASDVALLDSMWKGAKRYLHKTLDFVLVPASPRKKCRGALRCIYAKAENASYTICAYIKRRRLRGGSR